MRRALKVLTVSEFSRSELIALAGLDPARVAVVHGGVSARFNVEADAAMAARELGLRRPYVLTIATDDRRKNLQSLGDAARRLRASGIELVWAGDVRAHFSVAGGIPGGRMLGYVEDRLLPGLYRGARAFVLPSRYEGLGLTCLEAMACGTPVVASDRAALPETCGDAALLVDPDDCAALAEAVLRASTDEPLRERMRAKGLRRVRDRTWDRAASETHALLLEAAGGRKLSRPNLN
jgi:glycosyltransferase involved in cell wall biosynthesis